MTQAQETIRSATAMPSSPASAHASTGGAALDPRRWWILSIIVAGQFMFAMDAFIVNVAIPTISADLQASAAEIQAVIAIYLIAYATLVVTGGRLGDIHTARRVFLCGVVGFSLASLWCGLAGSGAELIVARLLQGATAALMVPQVLATIHVLFSGEERGRAFGIYGIVLGLGGTAGFLLGGLLVSIDVAGLAWRTVFFVNVPIGFVIAVAAWRLMPRVPPRTDVRLDLAGAATLFVGLLCLIAPVLLGHELGWAPALWLVMAFGGLVIAGFLRLERTIERRGVLPLIDLALLEDRSFVLGLCAVFCFFSGNLSFYFVVTLFVQGSLGYSPLDAGLIVMPLALAFVIASRFGAARAIRRGTRALAAGCALQIVGLAALALAVVAVQRPGMPLLAAVLTIFGWAQGLVMAPLSSVVLASADKASAGSASGLYGTTTHIANAVGVAVIGALFFAVREAASGEAALLAALAALAVVIAACTLFLASMRRHGTAEIHARP